MNEKKHYSNSADNEITNITWRRASALQTRFDADGVSVGGESAGYIDTISCNSIQIAAH